VTGESESIIFSTNHGNYFDKVKLESGWRNPCFPVEYSKQTLARISHHLPGSIL